MALTIACGLGSRQWSALPSWIGDFLWATMVFFGLSLLAASCGRWIRAGLALTVSCAVEFSQLLHPPWLDQLRETTLGHLVLGQGFFWGDLVAYAGGVAFAVLIDVELSVLAGRVRPLDQPARKASADQ